MVLASAASTLSNLTGATFKSVEIASSAAKKAVDLTGKTVDAAFVLGNDVVDASAKIGSAAVSVVGDTGTTAITTTGKVTTATLQTTGNIATAALGATEKASTSALNAAATIADAASGATAKVSTTILDTAVSTVSVAADVTKQTVTSAADVTKQTVTVAADVTKQTVDIVGENLKRGATLVGTVAGSTLVGLTNVTNIIANAGQNYAKEKLQTQDAKRRAIDAKRPKAFIDEIIPAVDSASKNFVALVNVSAGTRRVSILGQMSLLKKLTCTGFFGLLKRVVGGCTTRTMKMDIQKMELAISKAKTSIMTALTNAKASINAIPLVMDDEFYSQFTKIFDTFKTNCLGAIDELNTFFTTLDSSYDKAVNTALSPSGGRRKRTRRGKKATRVLSRKRPLVRVYVSGGASSTKVNP